MNTATSVGTNVFDPNPGNDSSTDTDTVNPAVTDIDCGLRLYDGTTTITFACEPGTPTSAFRINKNGTDYGVVVVDTTDPNASAVRVQTSGGIKALKAL